MLLSTVFVCAGLHVLEVTDLVYHSKKCSPSSHSYLSSPAQHELFLVYFVSSNPIGALQLNVSCFACADFKQKPYWQGKYQTMFFSWPIYSLATIGGSFITFYPCVKSICLPKFICQHSVNVSNISSFFYILERFKFDWYWYWYWRLWLMADWHIYVM